jgi:hypothetical protein
LAGPPSANHILVEYQRMKDRVPRLQAHECVKYVRGVSSPFLELSRHLFWVARCDRYVAARRIVNKGNEKRVCWLTPELSCSRAKQKRWA